MQRVLFNEGRVNSGCILVTPLLEIELAEILVDPILVCATAVAREILLEDFAPAEIREALADHAEGVGNATLILLFVTLVEVVADRELVIEQRDVLVQRLVVELLLVERPTELVESELV